MDLFVWFSSATRVLPKHVQDDLSPPPPHPHTHTFFFSLQFNIPCEKFVWLCLCKAKINAQAAVPTRLSKQWCVCQCLGFVTCAQMLTRATAHWGCRDTVIGSALETDTGRKIPGRTADSNPSQYCVSAHLSVRRCTH